MSPKVKELYSYGDGQHWLCIRDYLTPDGTQGTIIGLTSNMEDSESFYFDYDGYPIRIGLSKTSIKNWSYIENQSPKLVGTISDEEFSKYLYAESKVKYYNSHKIHNHNGVFNKPGMLLRISDNRAFIVIKQDLIEGDVNGYYVNIKTLESEHTVVDPIQVTKWSPMGIVKYEKLMMYRQLYKYDSQINITNFEDIYIPI